MWSAVLRKQALDLASSELDLASSSGVLEDTEHLGRCFVSGI